MKLKTSFRELSERSRSLMLLLVAVSVLMVFGPKQGGAAGVTVATGPTPPPQGEKQDESLTEINKQLTNPLSNV